MRQDLKDFLAIKNLFGMPKIGSLMGYLTFSSNSGTCSSSIRSLTVRPSSVRHVGQKDKVEPPCKPITRLHKFSKPSAPSRRLASSTPVSVTFWSADCSYSAELHRLAIVPGMGFQVRGGPSFRRGSQLDIAAPATKCRQDGPSALSRCVLEAVYGGCHAETCVQSLRITTPSAFA